MMTVALRDDVITRFSPQALERLQKELRDLDLEAAKQVNPCWMPQLFSYYCILVASRPRRWNACATSTLSSQAGDPWPEATAFLRQLYPHSSASCLVPVAEEHYSMPAPSEASLEM